MKNFSRVLRLALRHRLTFVLSVLSALGVAVLWGANIGVVYPFVEVAFEGKSLQTWVDDKIADSRDAIVDKNEEIERLTAELAETSVEEQGKIRGKIGLAETRVVAEQKAIVRYLRLKPYIDTYLPDDPFKTLALVTGFLLLGTIIKDLFLIANNILVAKVVDGSFIFQINF